MAKQTIGEFLSVLRKAHGYTQQEVAEKLNVSNKTLSSWETDRTAPDLLMLPEIAELYGITVDELLRGERSQTGEPVRVEFSEKSQRSARKSRYGKFTARCALYTSLACLCSLIFMFAGILFAYTEIPFWADLLLWLVGGLGAGVFIILIFYELIGFKTAEGLVTSEDITEENKAFVLVLKRRIASLLTIIAVPFLIGVIVFAAIYCDKFGDYNPFIIAQEHKIYAGCIALIWIFSALTLIILLTALLIANLKYKSLANEKQISTRKFNAKLAAKIFGFGAIPVVVTFILFAIMAGILPTKTEYIYKNKNYEDFKTHMHTLTVDGGVMHNGEWLLEAGEYPLNIPDYLIAADETIEVDYGMEFSYISGSPYSSGLILKTDSTIMVYVKNFNIYSFEDENGDTKYISNIAYRHTERYYTEEKYSVETSTYYSMGYDKENGYYFKCEKFTDYSMPFLYTFIATTVAAFAACTTAYIIKHKKQNYSF